MVKITKSEGDLGPIRGRIVEYDYREIEEEV